ncbi:hypothetical protein D3C86_1803700 [compost metagenome]
MAYAVYNHFRHFGNIFVSTVSLVAFQNSDNLIICFTTVQHAETSDHFCITQDVSMIE